MNIESIRIHQTKIPLKTPYKLSRRYGTLTDTRPVILEVVCDDGTVGLGETDPVALFTGETTETVVAVLLYDLAPHLIGADPTNIAEIHAIMDGCIRDMHVAKAAVDMACHDLLGKAAGMPLAVLLGGRRRTELPIMGSIGGGSPEENAREARDMTARGYRSLMVKIGGDPVEDAARTIAIDDALNGEIPLIPDANQGWDAHTALNYLKRVDGCRIDLLEQPVAASDIEGLRRIKDSTDVLLSADESLLSLEHAKILIEKQAVDVFSVKVSKNGGVFRSRQIIELAGHFGIAILFNSMIEEGISQAASFALGCACENLYPHGHAYFSPLRLEDDITDYSDSIRDGTVSLPAKPGLGVELNDEKLKRYTVKEYSVSG